MGRRRLGIDVGEGLVETLGEILPEGVGGFAVFVLAAGLVGEVARSLDVAVLQVIGPGADLAGAAFGEGFQI